MQENRRNFAPLVVLSHRRLRYALAITLIATALLSQRAVAAPATAGEQRASATDGLVTRITRSFSHAVSKTRMVAARQDWTVVHVDTRATQDDRIAPAPRVTLSPFQFRLPPPAV